jgi:ATPase subunit of ABC transporter with duplicated ATPase domains
MASRQASTLLAEPLSMKGSFVDESKKVKSSNAVVDLHDNGERESSKIEMNRRKEKKAALAAEKARLAQYGPSVHSQVDKMTFRRKKSHDTAAPDIHCRHVDLNFGSKFLLQDAELHLSRGRRYGLVKDSFFFLFFFFLFFSFLGGAQWNGENNVDAGD